MKQNPFGKFMAFLDKLEANAIPYTITRARDEALLINIAVPGERWEVEFMIDGAVEIERFRSDGEIADETALVELFARFAEPTNGHYNAAAFTDPVAAT
jgi:hypothetical protein